MLLPIEDSTQEAMYAHITLLTNLSEEIRLDDATFQTFLESIKKESLKITHRFLTFVSDMQAALEYLSCRKNSRLNHLDTALDDDVIIQIRYDVSQICKYAAFLNNTPTLKAIAEEVHCAFYKMQYSVSKINILESEYYACLSEILKLLKNIEADVLLMVNNLTIVRHELADVTSPGDLESVLKQLVSSMSELVTIDPELVSMPAEQPSHLRQWEVTSVKTLSTVLSFLCVHMSWLITTLIKMEESDESDTLWLHDVDPFPHHLDFYQPGFFVIDTLVLDRNTAVIEYHQLGCCVPREQLVYKAELSDLTDEQLDEVYYYKSLLIREPKLHSQKYVNAMGVQRNMDRMFQDLLDHRTHVIFYETDDTIVHISNGIDTSVPKWKLRDDQISWIRHLITKQ